MVLWIVPFTKFWQEFRTPDFYSLKLQRKEEFDNYLANFTNMGMFMKRWTLCGENKSLKPQKVAECHDSMERTDFIVTQILDQIPFTTVM